MVQSIQHTKGKVRAARVHITYDVETDGAIKMVSLPFVLGIVSALSGDRHKEQDPAKKLDAFEKREFKDISTVNFDDVLRESAPTLRFAVENKLQEGSDSKLKVALDFQSMKDFEPEQVALNLEPTKKLVELRQKMHSLLTRLEGQSEADRLLKEVISSTTVPPDAQAQPETPPAE